MIQYFHRIWKYLLLASILLGLIGYQYKTPIRLATKNFLYRQLALYNYGSELQILGKQYDLPWEYLLSLTILECSGKSPCGSRYEKHIFTKLQEVRDGKRPSFEEVHRKDVAGLTDEALQNLATSWGPFQIMGYHCIGLSSTTSTVTVSDLRGPDALHYSVRWVHDTYGKLLQNKRYEDAFHMHNTGHVISSNGIVDTYDPLYIDHGKEHMEYFTKKN